MDKKTRKFTIGFLLSLSTLVGCKFCSKPVGKKGNLPQKPATPLRGSDSEKISQKKEHELNPSNKSDDRAEESPIDDEELNHEFADISKEIENIKQNLDKLSKDEEMELEGLEVIAKLIKSIKTRQTEIQKYNGEMTIEEKAKLAETQRNNIRENAASIKMLFGGSAGINKYANKYASEKDKLNSPCQEQPKESLKPLRMKVVKFCFKHASDIVSINTEMLMEATKLTRDEIDSLKAPFN
jgi:hypothetical protein